MLLPFIATVGWKKARWWREVVEVQETINSQNELIMVGSVPISTLPCFKQKEMIEKLFYIYKSTWYELSPPPPLTFSLFFTNHHQQNQNAPTLILSTALSWNLRCFSPLEYMWISPQKHTVAAGNSDMFFSSLRKSQNHWPRYFNMGENKTGYK